MPQQSRESTSTSYMVTLHHSQPTWTWDSSHAVNEVTLSSLCHSLYLLLYCCWALFPLPSITAKLATNLSPSVVISTNMPLAQTCSCNNVTLAVTPYSDIFTVTRLPDSQYLSENYRTNVKTTERTTTARFLTVTVLHLISFELHEYRRLPSLLPCGWMTR